MMKERTQWHGPGKVIDIDGKTVIVKHDGACIKVHAVSLKMKPQESDDADSTIPSVSSDYSSAITENSQGLEESSGARSSAKQKNCTQNLGGDRWYQFL